MQPRRGRVRSTETWSAVSAIAACVATALAVWATWESRESAVQSKQAIRASVWMQMLNDYAAPEMLSAMKELRNWQLSRTKDFDKAFTELLLKKVKSVDEQRQEDQIDGARRRVGQFFNKLRVLCKIHVMDERDIGLTWSKGTYTFVSQVLLPLENAKSEALLAQGGITADDKKDADAIQQETLQFYRRVFEVKGP